MLNRNDLENFERPKEIQKFLDEYSEWEAKFKKEAPSTSYNPLWFKNNPKPNMPRILLIDLDTNYLNLTRKIINKSWFLPKIFIFSEGNCDWNFWLIPTFEDREKVFIEIVEFLVKTNNIFITNEQPSEEELKKEIEERFPYKDIQESDVNELPENISKELLSKASTQKADFSSFLMSNKKNIDFNNHLKKALEGDGVYAARVLSYLSTDFHSEYNYSLEDFKNYSI